MAESSNPLNQLSDNAANVFSEISSTLSTWKGNLSRNTAASFDNMSPKAWLRLVIIVCTYLLIRPYLVKLGAKVQQSQMEKAMKEHQANAQATAGTKMNANDLRGGRQAAKVDVPGEESEEDEGWGKKQRLRQRKAAKRAMEIHEQNLADKGNESDKDIEDLLED